MSSTSRLRMRRSVNVKGPEHVFGARRTIRQFAKELGFDDRAAEELALVASELASNMLKYASGGTMELSATGDTTHGPGMRIVARDEAPTFDLAAALPDGHDGRGSIDPALLFGRRGIGAGLGAVARLTDRLSLEPLERGKQIVAVRYVRRGKRG